MTVGTHSISPLRQRMRKLAPKTQAGYVRAAKCLAGFLGRSPDSATVEDLRRF
jgi:integrase/recombinase XerD